MKVETELKWAMDVDGHDRLARHLHDLLGPPQILVQDNRFYDSADRRLHAARMNVRVRHENDRWVLTCKRKTAAVDPGTGTHRHDEHECQLPGPDLPLPLPQAWSAVLAGAELTCLGGFANRRQEWHDGPHLLCLDATDYGVRVDHELEIESDDPQAAHARWSVLLAGWGITWQAQPATKFARYLMLRQRD